VTFDSLRSTKSQIGCEERLLTILESSSLKGRGSKTSTQVIEAIEELVNDLEIIGKQQNLAKSPINVLYLDGCWKLLYTSSPGTNSPIQRTFTSIDEGIQVFQVVNLVKPNRNGIVYSYLGNDTPEVSNTICFGDKIRLRITALASTVC
jgi:hypothetical protein